MDLSMMFSVVHQDNNEDIRRKVSTFTETEDVCRLTAA